MGALPQEVFREPDPADLPEYLKPKRRGRNLSRRRSARRSRSRRGKRSWLSRSRSRSHTQTGQYIRAVGCTSSIRWWERKQSRSSSSSRSRSRSQETRRGETPEAGCCQWKLGAVQTWRSDILPQCVDHGFNVGPTTEVRSKTAKFLVRGARSHNRSFTLRIRTCFFCLVRAGPKTLDDGRALVETDVSLHLKKPVRHVDGSSAYQ